MASAWTIERFVRALLRGAGNPELPRSRWRLAEYPPSPTIHLFVDGWLSAANEHHLAVVHDQQAQLVDPKWRAETRAFSYSRPGATYVGDDTLGSLSGHVGKLVRVLDRERRDGHWIVSAYSLGAAVTTLALERLATQDDSLRRRIPLVILVEPTVHGAPDLLDFLASETGGTLFPKEIPAIVLNLADEESRYPRRARQAISTLLDAGIAVAVLYAPQDRFAPYRPLEDRRIFHFPIDPALTTRRTIDPIAAHVWMRVHEAVHHTIYCLVKPVI